MSKNLALHLGIYGKTNVGKSSFINALSQQQISIVSNKKGTTTDPSSKSIELSGLGAVVLIDTAGIDDTEEVIGDLRIAKTLATLEKIDCAIVLVSNNNLNTKETEFLHTLKEKNIKFLICYNKTDVEPITPEFLNFLKNTFAAEVLSFSCQKNFDAAAVIKILEQQVAKKYTETATILGDLVKQGDTILLVTPIDIEAPKGRLILPQVQTIRDILDNDCFCVVCKERELDLFWKTFNVKPKLVVTDSQVFLKTAASVPLDINLTSFSILMARLKGDFNKYIQGTPTISSLKNNDKILILESCSHHTGADDIGRVKIPRWLTSYTGKNLEFIFIAGCEKLPDNLSEFSLVVQCGGCMLTKTQVMNRLMPAIELNIPVTNYGMTIAYCMGIFNRAIKPFTNSDNANYSDLL